MKNVKLTMDNEKLEERRQGAEGQHERDFRLLILDFLGVLGG